MLWPKIVARHEAVMHGREPAGVMGPMVSSEVAGNQSGNR
jgi:hypothetical protein